MCRSLINRFNVSGPRYLSYPNVAFWKPESFSLSKWQGAISSAFLESETKEVSLFVHLPFCAESCSICEGRKKNEDTTLIKCYLDSVLIEWQLYIETFGKAPTINALHISGGIPKHFSANILKTFISKLLEPVILKKDYEFTFEVYPGNTSEAHLKVLRNLGFQHLRFATQNYNVSPVNSAESLYQVKHFTKLARAMGYTSIIHDVVYGLPYQTKTELLETINNTVELKPERIAFYSYDLAPWINNYKQQVNVEGDFIRTTGKLEHYKAGVQMLEGLGYVEMGSGFFELKTQKVVNECKTYQPLRHNKAVYADMSKALIIGLGVSSVSDIGIGFAQNATTIERYLELMEQNIFPIQKGHMLSHQDLVIRQHILNLMYDYKTSWFNDDEQFMRLPEVLNRLKEHKNKDLVGFERRQVVVTEKGKPFIHNICMTFNGVMQGYKVNRQKSVDV